jgi:hypothetical protein
LQIPEDLVVPVPNDRYVFFRKPQRAALVCVLLLCGMLSAVEFDGQPKAWAKEVKRKRPDRMLPSEQQAIELAAAKRTPEPSFCIRHVTAEFPCTCCHQLCA